MLVLKIDLLFVKSQAQAREMNSEFTAVSVTFDCKTVGL